MKGFYMKKWKTYEDAVEELDLILCNDMRNIDVSVIYNLPKNIDAEDIYQWFLTNASNLDVEERPGLIWTYSNLLGLYVLAVNHFGKPWEDVPYKE